MIFDFDSEDIQTILFALDTARFQYGIARQDAYQKARETGQERFNEMGNRYMEREVQFDSMAMKIKFMLLDKEEVKDDPNRTL